MERIDARLADGRYLAYYFDRACPAQGLPADRRELPEVRTASELRYDALRDEWVVVAAHRQGRTHLPSDDQWPLCPSTAERATEIPAFAYDVAVFENRFPSRAGRDLYAEVLEAERASGERIVAATEPGSASNSSRPGGPREDSSTSRDRSPAWTSSSTT
ncbi:hypothetical protein [Streptodolium elevatio]|uniref:Uncharacterized protein n=1 Tax=Streptodolium elevatio TaxID=3157996 RepID=A0ABV3DKC5_9ACTN